MFMLHEKTSVADSFWKPYLDCLPEEFSSIPYTWSKHELYLYIGKETNLYKIVQKKISVLKKSFDLIHERCHHLFQNSFSL